MVRGKEVRQKLPKPCYCSILVSAPIFTGSPLFAPFLSKTRIFPDILHSLSLKDPASLFCLIFLHHQLLLRPLPTAIPLYYI